MPAPEFTIDANGYLDSCRYVPSENCDRRPNSGIDLLVIHCISLPPGQFGNGAIDALFTNQLQSDQEPYFKEIAHLNVSAHLLIDRQGALTQYVSFYDRAWHCGQSSWQGRERCNDFSIGIELEGTFDSGYRDNQYLTLITVTRSLLRQFPEITKERIVGHSDIAVGRKFDPGAKFEWKRYLQALDT